MRLWRNIRRYAHPDAAQSGGRRILGLLCKYIESAVVIWRLPLEDKPRQILHDSDSLGRDADVFLPHARYFVRHAFIVPSYTAPTPIVVNAIRAVDRFLASLGYLSGEPTPAVSEKPAWTPQVPAKK